MSLMIHIDELKLSEIKREDGILKKTIKQFTNEQKLQIQGGRYEYYKWDFIFSKTKQLTSEALSLNRNYLPEILKDILHIQMHNLATLSLALNNIGSLEKLCNLNAPNLENLILSENRITTTRLLRKMPFKLKSLSIDGNLIRELTNFSQISWKDEIKALMLEQYKGQSIVDENLLCLVKVSSQSISTFHMKKRSNFTFLTQLAFQKRFKRHDIVDPRF